jgi:hypothetical protein
LIIIPYFFNTSFIHPWGVGGGLSYVIPTYCRSIFGKNPKKCMYNGRNLIGSLLARP